MWSMFLKLSWSNVQDVPKQYHVNRSTILPIFFLFISSSIEWRNLPSSIFTFVLLHFDSLECLDVNFLASQTRIKIKTKQKFVPQADLFHKCVKLFFKKNYKHTNNLDILVHFRSVCKKTPSELALKIIEFPQIVISFNVNKSSRQETFWIDLCDVSYISIFRIADMIIWILTSSKFAWKPLFIFFYRFVPFFRK